MVLADLSSDDHQVCVNHQNSTEEGITLRVKRQSDKQIIGDKLQQISQGPLWEDHTPRETSPNVDDDFARDQVLT